MKRKKIAILTLLLSFIMPICIINADSQTDIKEIAVQNNIESQEITQTEEEEEETIQANENKDNLKSIIEELDLNEKDKELLITHINKSDDTDLIEQLNNFFLKFKNLNNLVENLNHARNPKEIQNLMTEITKLYKVLNEDFANLSSYLSDKENSTQISASLKKAIDTVQRRLQEKQNEINMIQETVKAVTMEAMQRAQSNITGQIEEKQSEAKKQVQDKLEEAQKKANDKLTDAQKQIKAEVEKQVKEILEKSKEQIKQEIKKQVQEQLQSAKNEITENLAAFKSTIETTISNQAILKDIPQNTWYSNAVKFAVTNKLMQGYPDGKFHPEKPINRSMIISVLYNLEHQPKVEFANIYTDIPKDTWYSNAAIWAYNNNITKGIIENQFSPEETITREELAMILYNYANLKGKNTQTTDIISKFIDSNQLSPKSITPMNWIVSNGIINGTNYNTLDPKKSVTRSQIALILQKIIESKLI